MRAPRQSEKAFQSAVIEYAQLNGWLVYHTHDSRRSEVGFPDLVLCRAPRIVFAELKSEGGRLTDTQREWLDELGRCRIETYLWRPANWPYIEGTLRSETVVPFRRPAADDGPDAPPPPEAA